MMVGLLLAAGAGTRMGSPKPLVRKNGQTFLTHGIRNLWCACNEVVVVLGNRAPVVRKAVEEEFQELTVSGKLHEDLVRADRHGAAGLEVHFTVNPGWKRGMLSSVHVGLKHALRFKSEAVLVLPVDHPDLKPATVHDLATVMRLAMQACRSDRERDRFSYALVPRFRGDRGHPVALSRALAQSIARDRKAENLSDAVRRNARLLGFFDVQDRGVTINRNTPESRPKRVR
jgi:CTP:molybdopterin cytidylyltransferase MocA